MSDSSASVRSPHNGTSPIELPPLSGARDERRSSSAPMLQLGVPGAFAQEADYSMSRFGDQKQMASAPMLQESFMPYHSHQLYPQQPQYMNSQPRYPSPLQLQTNIPAPNCTLPSQPWQQPSAPHHATPTSATTSYPANVQLPRISSLPTSTDALCAFDPNAAHRTPISAHSALSPDGSPRDKMSLSNLTH